MGRAAAASGRRSVDLSCPDWAKRQARGQSLIKVRPVNQALADRAIAVFNRLRLADVPGTPSMAEAGGEWFREIVGALFGALDPKSGQRLIRELFLGVPKKNSKTTNGALLMLTALLLNERPKCKMIMTAPVLEVANLAFSAAAGAIALDPVLEKKFHVRDHVKTIVHRETKAELQIMTFDPAVLTGQKPVAALIDELHVVAKLARASSAIRQLRGGMLPYPEAFLAFITTQSEEPPTGVFKAELQKARDIRDGKQAGAMLPVLYELPDEVQKSGAWRNSALWPRVTPNAGRSISIERLVEDFETAQATGEEELRAWASQHLNVEIGLALRSDRWVGADFWERTATALSLEGLIARSEVIVVGVDGGGLDDMLGLAVLGREKGTGRWLLWTHAWIDPVVLERRKAEAARFRTFEKDGDLTIISSPGADITDVADIIERIEKSGLLDRIGVDQHGLGTIPDELVSRGIAIDRIPGIPQGWRMTGAIKTAERQLHDGAFLHAAQPLMDWCIGNTKVEPRGNAVMITKQVSGFGKIDTVMAMLDAVALMAMNPEPRGAPRIRIWN